MKKYKCGHIEVEETTEPQLNNAIRISNSNVSIERDDSKCINCGLCIKACTKKEGMDFGENSDLCVNCGQCTQVCPVGCLVVKNDKDNLLKALSNEATTIAYTSPAVRTSFAECFGMEAGTFSQEKLVGALRLIGFKYVFDTSFGADLTIMEEANELVGRLKNKGKFPMFTSCCPSWIKYAEQFYPDILENISSCKSPIGMMGIIVKEYFCKSIGIVNPYTVAVTPCTAKKFELKRPEIDGTDLVVTITELANILKEKGIKYEEIPESNFDSVLGEGSGAGVIFGNTGGVMEATLRTTYKFITGNSLEKVVFEEVRGNKNLKEAEIIIDSLTLKVAVVNGITSVKSIIEDIRNNKCKYDFIEVMNCEGGCNGGGGQPKLKLKNEQEEKEKRIKSLYERDSITNIKCSYDNPNIKLVYEKFLKEPGSKLAKELLHSNKEEK